MMIERAIYELTLERRATFFSYMRASSFMWEGGAAGREPGRLGGGSGTGGGREKGGKREFKDGGMRE